MDAQQQELTPARKFEERTKKWKFPEGIKFASPAVEQAYQRRVQMFIDVISLRKPERVPVCPASGFFPFVYAGVTPKDAMYDYEKLGYALKKFHADFLPDNLAGTALYGPGKVLEILDYKLYRWPGHGVPPTEPYQCIEDEYMRADEYEALINDPTDFFLRTYLPRVFGTLGPWRMLEPFTDILELPSTGPSIVPFGLPEMQQALKQLLDAGQAAIEWIQACRSIDTATMSSLGLPGLMGGFTKAPFDTVGDTLRGTRAVMLDKFRQPKKLLAAMERFVPLAIDAGVRSAKHSRSPVVFMPLHKGADSFMSGKDFSTFYWPTLKAVILGLIKEGLIPYLFAEGGYNKRLDIITDPDIPAGTTIWMFDQTELREVKKRFTGWACFGGNVPSSLLVAGTTAEVQAHVKRLIDDVGQDGGYILSTGAVVDDAIPANMHAMIDTGKEYGVYRSS
ncbi:MAG TPA: uroporphyrinogen decarboxylase family protein [Candidatus Acidoferrales bacterium]|nr:uroporphyrinogen decarboxylase family protein [Candidatus Acidoferrales bacterium]